MNIEPGTRIGADGDRHPAGTEPSDASKYNRRLVRVQGALEDGHVPVWDEDEEGWLLGEGGGGGGGASSYEDLTDVDMTGLVNGQVPTWDGAKWVPGDALTSSDVGTTVATPGQVSAAQSAAEQTAAGLVAGLGPADVGADPAGSADSVRDELALEIAGRLPLDGSVPMAGPLDLDGHSISGLPAPTTDDHAARLVDVVAVEQRIDGLSSDLAGGIPLKSNLAREVGEVFKKAQTELVNVVWFGDSISVMGDTLGRVMWNISPFAGHRRVTSMRHMTTSGIGMTVSSNEGASATDSLASYGATLTPGQKATYNFTGDGVSVVYQTRSAAGGAITVRNGVGGTSLGVIDPTGADGKSGNVWTSPAFTRDAVTIEIENTGTGNVVVDGMLAHDSNRTEGIHAYQVARAGNDAAWYISDPVRGLDLVENLEPELVFVHLGTNGTDHTVQLGLLCDEITSRSPDAKLVGIVPYANAAITQPELDEIAAFWEARVECIGVIDFSKLIPNPIKRGLLSGDNVHPSSDISRLSASLVAAAVTGDRAAFGALNTLDSNPSDTSVLTGGLRVNGTFVITPTNPLGGGVQIGNNWIYSDAAGSGMAITSGLSLVFGQPPDLPLQAGNLEACQATGGLILRSPNGKRWRLTVDDAGVLSSPVEIT